MSLWIDIRFPPPVGRIHRRDGGTQVSGPYGRNARIALLNKLYYKQGQVELVHRYKRQEVTIEELLDADRRGAVERLLADRGLTLPLWPTFDDLYEHGKSVTVEGVTTRVLLGKGPKTRLRYKVSFNRLRSLGVLDKGARVSDLGTVPWRELLEDWPTSGSDWMHLRRAVLRFLTVHLGEVFHPFRQQVRKAFPATPENEREPDIDPDRFLDIVAVTPDWLQPVWMTLAITGLRVGEYLELGRDRLRPTTCGVLVRNALKGNRVRESVVSVDEALWPWVEAGVPSPLRYKALRLRWIEACEAAEVTDLRMHDLRHCRGQWAHDAGSSLVAVQQALRHRSIHMTARYARRRMRREDAAVFGGVLAPAINRRKAGSHG